MQAPHTSQRLLFALLLAGLIGFLFAAGTRGRSSDPHALAIQSPPVHSSAELKSLAFPVHKTETQWQNELESEAFRVLRKKGTERPFTGSLLENHTHGTYICGGCGQQLFSSQHKFESGTGWPSYFDVVHPDSVLLVEDASLLMTRIEVLCSRCGGHLGHVFNDGPAPTGLRYCINSAALGFAIAPSTPADSGVTNPTNLE